MLKVTKAPYMKKFSEIPVGGMLEFNDTIYVKIQNLKYGRIGVTFNVVRLDEENTEVGWFEPNDELAYYPNAELTLSF